MKIVHIVMGKANPDRLNGVNRVVHELAIEMSNQNMMAEVWGLTKTPSATTFSRSYSLLLFSTALWNKKINQVIAKLPKDTIIHFHGVFIPLFYYIAKKLEKRGITWVISPHGALAKPAFNWQKRFYFRWFDRWLLSRAKAVHALNPIKISGTMWNSQRPTYTQWLPDQRPAYIY